MRFLRQGRWEYVERHNCTGIVIVVAVNKDGKLILIEQLRIPVAKKVIEFPAGLVNDRKLKTKESLITAAKRELLEETGYIADRMFKIMSGPISAGSSADIVTILKAEGIRKVDHGGGDHTEDITVHEVPLAKIEAWLILKQKRGYLVDPKIYAGLYFLKKYNGKDF